MSRRGGQGAGITGLKKPAPPKDIAECAQRVWLHTVNAMPLEWFPPETWPILVRYCYAVCRSMWFEDQLERKMVEAEDGQGIDTGTIDDLQKMLGRERVTIGDLATKMRLTQQSMYNPKASKGKGGTNSPKPWDSDDEST